MTRRRLFSALALCLLVATSAFAQPGGAPAPDTRGEPAVDLLIQGAVDTELQPLLAALEGAERIQIGAWTFWRGRMGGKRVVVSRTEA